MKPKTKLITFKIDEGSLQKWEEYCKSKNLNRTELIRSAVSDYIQDIKKDRLLLHYTRIVTTKLEQNLEELKDMLQKREEKRI